MLDEKSCMCFVDMVAAFYGIPRNLLVCLIRNAIILWMMSVNEGQGQESEWILSCQRSVRLRWGCTKDLCCHFFAVAMDFIELN